MYAKIMIYRGNPTKSLAVASISAVGLGLQVAWIGTIALPFLWLAESVVGDLF